MTDFVTDENERALIIRCPRQFEKTCLEQSKFFVSLNPSVSLRQIFKEKALEKIFCAVASLEEAYQLLVPKVAPPKTTKLNTEFVAPLLPPPPKHLSIVRSILRGRSFTYDSRGRKTSS